MTEGLEGAWHGLGMFYVLIWVVGTWVFTQVKIHGNVHFKFYLNFFFKGRL